MDDTGDSTLAQHNCNANAWCEWALSVTHLCRHQKTDITLKQIANCSHRFIRIFLSADSFFFFVQLVPVLKPTRKNKMGATVFDLACPVDH